ncbi:MAG: hypothetical protein UZ17_ACD001002640 [Acidobacteria bacterium OLB17]|nr:MAG: hypothetical protein UZ17_ACD001002640 [Acidobacteria bacterium OLB17]MCZ2390866.1 hypothetical protein [Acidobacteriota bacterium]
MYEIRINRFEASSAHLLLPAFIAACALGAVLIGSFPLQLSIITIFLFAGPHNFMEFRYFVARMPVRWGRSRTYYMTGIGGVVVLASAYLTLYFASGNWLWADVNWELWAAFWNTGLILWVGSLFYLRGRQRRSDWSLAIAVACLLAGAAWIVPLYWSLALVYVHPFVAMWFLERQIRRTRPEWLRAYHCCLATIPVFLLMLWVMLSGRPALPEDTSLFSRIVQHAGGGTLSGVSSHFLVATHVFLESIHYFVWLLLIPLVDCRAIPWRLKEIPLFSNANGWPKLVTGLLIVSLSLVLVLWFGFSVDYLTARDVYFAFAIGHVLAEFPFLVKML